jgi:hypothetical protein
MDLLSAMGRFEVPGSGFKNIPQGLKPFRVAGARAKAEALAYLEANTGILRCAQNDNRGEGEEI